MWWTLICLNPCKPWFVYTLVNLNSGFAVFLPSRASERSSVLEKDIELDRKMKVREGRRGEKERERGWERERDWEGEVEREREKYWLLLGRSEMATPSNNHKATGLKIDGGINEAVHPTATSTGSSLSHWQTHAQVEATHTSSPFFSFSSLSSFTQFLFISYWPEGSRC